MKCILLLLVALCVTFSVQGKSVQLEERLETRNAVIDKILEELKKAEHVAKELLEEAKEKIEKAFGQAFEDWENLKAKIQEAAAKGEAMSKEMIAEAKAKILKKYQEIKPIVDNLKAKAKAAIEKVVQQIKDSDAISSIKAFAEKVKDAINGFIDHIPDYEDWIKEKFEEVKSRVMEEAKIIRAIIIGKAHEAEQKLQGLIVIAKKMLEEDIKPKVKAELEQIIDLAEQKFAKASATVKEVVSNLDNSIDAIAELINDKTGGAAKPLIEKAEAQLKDLIAKGEVKIDEVTTQVQELLEELKAKIQDRLGFEYGAKCDIIVEKIMSVLEGPLSKLPDSIRPFVSSAIESALRFGCSFGKTAVAKLLDFISAKFPAAKSICDMAKMALGMFGKRGASTEIAIAETMKALDKAMAHLPENLREWVKTMVEEVLRFGIGNGKAGINILLDMIVDKFGDEVKPAIDAVKEVIDKVVYVQTPVDPRGASTEVIVREVMNALEKPFAALPEDIREWVKVMIEQVIRFGIGHGKNGINILLDMIVEKFGDSVKPVIDAVKEALNKIVYGATTEVLVKKVMEALEGPLEKLPADIRDWIKVMVEQALRFGLEHGTKGINHLLDLITEKFGDSVKPVIDAIKDIIGNVVYMPHLVTDEARNSAKIVDIIMEKLEGPLSQLPEAIRGYITTMIEQTLRFGLLAGKDGAKKLLDLIEEKVPAPIKSVIEMVKMWLDKYVYSTEVRGAGTEALVKLVMDALEKPFSELPDDIKDWCKFMIEDILRFGLKHGTTGVIKGLEKLDDITGGKLTSIVDTIKEMLEKYGYSVQSAGTEALVKLVMDALEEPFSKLPEDIKDWVKLMIEEILRFGLKHGKTGVIKGLERLDDLTKGKITSIVDVIKEMLDKYGYAIPVDTPRAAGTDALVKLVMDALEKPLANLPEDIRVWVKLMIQEILEFGLAHGKTGVIIGLERLDDLTGGKITSIVDVVKEMLDKYGYSIEKRGSGIDKAVDLIMSKLEEPFSKIPENLREWVTEMVEGAIRFAFGHGKKGSLILLDLIASKTDNAQVKMVITMVKTMLDQYAYAINESRGDGIDKAVDLIMSKLEEPFSKIPENLREWVTEMVEEAIRFAFGHGKKGALVLLDFIATKTDSAEVKAVIAMVKTMLDQYAYAVEEVRGSGIDKAVDLIMSKLEEPFSKLPENVREWVTEMVEQAIRFAFGHGKKGALVLLDLIASKTDNAQVKAVIAMVKTMLDQYAYAVEGIRGSGIDKAVDLIMSKLEEPFSKLPENLREWVTEMVEQAIRFAFGHGKKGALVLLDLIASKTENAQVKAVIAMVKTMLDQYAYSIESRAKGIDAAVDKIMSLLEKPFAKIPENLREWVTEMVEGAIRFAFEHGKTGAMHLLDLIGDKFGPEVKAVIAMVKTMLDQYAY